MNSKKTMKRIFIVALTLLIVVGTLSISLKAYDFGYRVFTETAIDEVGHGFIIDVTITEDMSEKDIAEMLYQYGLVRDANLFYLQLKLSAYTGKIEPGTYKLRSSMEPKEMMIAMAAKEKQ